MIHIKSFKIKNTTTQHLDQPHSHSVCSNTHGMFQATFRLFAEIIYFVQFIITPIQPTEIIICKVLACGKKSHETEKKSAEFVFIYADNRIRWPISDEKRVRLCYWILILMTYFD